MKDIFRPTREPELTLYLAFQREGKKREGREFEEWHSAELNAVFNAACKYAEKHGLREPTFDEVCSEEQYASGHTDYGAKWARGVAEIMRKV